jgi:hypothetical protein
VYPASEEVVVWDITTGEIIRRFYASGTALNFDPSGTWLALASYTVWLWKVNMP